jgi:hypothetical protein
VIEAVYFRERRREVQRYQPSFDQESPGAANGAAAGGAPVPSAKAQRSEAADEFAATGMGSRERHEVTTVDFDLEPNPVASVRIRYEFHPQLVKLGILPDHISPLERRERASGFGSYCPER